MASTEAVTPLSLTQSSSTARFAERYFYQCMSLLIAAVVVYGFNHTIDRRLIHAHPRPPILLWIHAVVFSSWVGFYILQWHLYESEK